MGIIFAVIGNSGAGKDSVIEEVKKMFPGTIKELKIPRRVITRAGSDTEMYEHVEKGLFQEMRASGEFILEWESYNHHYGIRREVFDWVEEGHPVMMNISRTVVKSAREMFPNMKLIFISVPLEVTAERIIERGRESYTEVLNRVVRAQDLQEYENADLVVDNVGDLQETSRKVLNFVLESIKA